MTKLFTLLLLATCFAVIAQDCQNPVSAYSFQQFFNTIASQPTNDKKLERANELLSKNCLTSEQVKNIAILFKDDAIRLQFCKSAWHKTFDRVNFFDVYDTFTSLSTAIRLYDYTKSDQAADIAPTVEIIPSPAEIIPIFGDLAYPSHLNYSGPTGCSGPVISEDAFMTIARKACCLPYDDSRSEYILESSTGMCLSMAHAMKLTSFIHTHALRLTTMKALFPRIYDQGNYKVAASLFNTQELKTDWLETIQLTLTPAPTSKTPVDCTATDVDLNNTIKSVNSKTFPSDKMDALKLAARNKCFSMSQIRKLCELFMMENDKLSIMKIFYARCTDRDHYDQLTDVFIAYYYQQELMTFIKNGGK
jgi:hypothetical protein